MRKTLLISILIFFLNNAFSQQRYSSKLFVDTQFKDSFSFAAKWQYPWETLKLDNGRFSSTFHDKITAKDTTHLYYTANCSTNVQGGYNIQYCYATNDADELILNFSDGLPAYASDFRVYIKNDSFYFEPKTVYPASSQREKKTYRIDKEKLALDKSQYKPGEMVKGYVDVDFTELTELPGKPIQETNFFLKGFFRTAMPLQNQFFIGLEEKCFINSKGKKECYTDPANPQRKWYNYSEMHLKGDSVFVDQMSVAIFQKDTSWSASDGGFYYYTGTWTQSGASIIVELTELYCDYCAISKGKTKRTKLWHGRITEQGILINGHLFRVASHTEPLDSERGLPH